MRRSTRIAEEFMNTSETAMPRPVYKRKVKNYLIDVGLQLRYTATIVIVAVGAHDHPRVSGSTRRPATSRR